MFLRLCVRAPRTRISAVPRSLTGRSSRWRGRLIVASEEAGIVKKGEPSMITALAVPAPAADPLRSGRQARQRRAQPLGGGRSERRLPVHGIAAEDLDARGRAVEANQRARAPVEVESQRGRALLLGVGA